MFQTTYQLLTFFDSLASVNGRKKLQKMIHLLKSADTGFPFKYEYHHYGRYYATLKKEVNRLVEEQFIEEVNQEGTYIYTITDKGKKFKKMLETERNFSFELNEALLEKLAQESSQFLEMVST